MIINLNLFWKRRKLNLWLNRPKKIGKYYTTQRSIKNDVKTPISTAKKTYLARHYCKRLRKNRKKSWLLVKKLFDNCETGNVVDELVKIIPNIVTRLRKEEMLADFVTFLRQISIK